MTPLQPPEKPEPPKVEKPVPGYPVGWRWNDYDWAMGCSGYIMYTDGHWRDKTGKRVD